MSRVIAVNDLGRPVGEDNARAVYLDDEVELVLSLALEGYTATQIAMIMGMPRRTVRDYLSGRRRNQSIAGFRVVRRRGG